ncbi:unnamed protein product, partial [Mesorhabditis spiculigera]
MEKGPSNGKPLWISKSFVSNKIKNRILAYQCTDGEPRLQWLMDCNCGVGDIGAWEMIGNDYVIASGPGGTAKITVSNVISEGPKLLPAVSMCDFLGLKSAELKEFFIAGDRMLWLYKGHLVQSRVESAFLDKPLEEAPDFPVGENGIYEKILAVNTSTNLVVLLRNDEGVTYKSFDVSAEDAPIEVPPRGFINKASVKELLDLKILPDLFLTPPNVYRPAGQSGDTKDFMETCLTLVDACIDKISFVCHAQRAPEFEPDSWEVVWGRGQVEDEMVKTAFLFIDDQEYLIGITQSGLVYGPAKGHGTWMPFTEAGEAKQSERYNFVDMQCLYEKQQILLLMQGAFVLTCGWFIKEEKLIFQQLRFDSIPDLREAKCFLSHATQRCLVFGWGHLPRYWTNDDHYSPLIYDYETKRRWASSRHNLREMHAARELCSGVHIGSDGNASMIAMNGENERFHLALERDEVVTVQPGLIPHKIEKVVAAPFDDLGFTLIAAVGGYRATLLIYQPENALGSIDVLELMIKGHVEDPSMPEVLILKRTRRCGPRQANCMYIPQTYEWWEGFFWMYYVKVIDCKRKLCTGDCGQGDYMAIGQYGIMPEAKWFSTLRRDAVAMKQVHSKEPRFQMTFKRSTQKRGSDVEVYYVEEEGDSKAKYALWNVARTKFAFGKVKIPDFSDYFIQGLPHYTYIDYDGKTISLLNQENFVTVKIRNTDSLWPRELDFGKDPCYFLHKRGEEIEDLPNIAKPCSDLHENVSADSPALCVLFEDRKKRVFGSAALSTENEHTPVIYDYETKTRWSSSTDDLGAVYGAKDLRVGLYIGSDRKVSLMILKRDDAWTSVAMDSEKVVALQPALIQHTIRRVVAAPFESLGFTLTAAIGDYRTTVLVYQPETELLIAANEHAGEKNYEGCFAMAQTTIVNGVLDQEDHVKVKVRSTDTALPKLRDFGKGTSYFLHRRGEAFVWVLAQKSDGTKNFFPTTGLMNGITCEMVPPSPSTLGKILDTKRAMVIYFGCCVGNWESLKPRHPELEQDFSIEEVLAFNQYYQSFVVRRRGQRGIHHAQIVYELNDDDKPAYQLNFLDHMAIDYEPEVDYCLPTKQLYASGAPALDKLIIDSPSILLRRSLENGWAIQLINLRENLLEYIDLMAPSKIKAVFLHWKNSAHIIIAHGSLLYFSNSQKASKIACMQSDEPLKQEQYLLCLLGNGTVITFGCICKNETLSITQLSWSKNPYMERAMGFFSTEDYLTVLAGIARGANPLNEKATSIVLYDHQTETLICTSVKDYSLLVEGERRFYSITVSTNHSQNFLCCTFGTNDEISGVHIEDVIVETRRLQRPLYLHSVKKMVAAIGSQVSIFAYQPGPEIFLKVNEHSWSKEYYDGTFANTREATSNGRRFLKSTLFLLSSEGVEVLDLIIKGTVFELERSPAILLPEVIITKRTIFTNLFLAESLEDWQICTITSKTNEEGLTILFFLNPQRSMLDDGTEEFSLDIVIEGDPEHTQTAKRSTWKAGEAEIEFQPTKNHVRHLNLGAKTVALVDKETYYDVTLSLGFALPQSRYFFPQGISHLLVRKKKEYCFVAIRDNKVVGGVNGGLAQIDLESMYRSRPVIYETVKSWACSGQELLLNPNRIPVTQFNGVVANLHCLTRRQDPDLVIPYAIDHIFDFNQHYRIFLLTRAGMEGIRYAIFEESLVEFTRLLDLNHFILYERLSNPYCLPTSYDYTSDPSTPVGLLLDRPVILCAYLDEGSTIFYQVILVTAVKLLDDFDDCHAVWWRSLH